MGVCAGRTAELVAGAARHPQGGRRYLPLDPAYPGERLAFMLEDARRPRAGDRSGACATRCPRPARVVCLDEDARGGRERARRASTARRHAGDNLAYVIYTSGSTGRPKGVAIEHRSAVGADRAGRADVFAPTELRGVLAVDLDLLRPLGLRAVRAARAAGGTVILAENAWRCPGCRRRAR